MLHPLTKVVVRPGFWGRLFRKKSRPGFTITVEIGKYSKKPIYSILLNDGGIIVAFEDELGVVAPPAYKKFLDGATVH